MTKRDIYLTTLLNTGCDRNSLPSFYTSQKIFIIKFFDWCRMMAEDSIVFVSSYNAPEDFEEIFSISRKITGIRPDLLKKNKPQKNRLINEKLYII